MKRMLFALIAVLPLGVPTLAEADTVTITSGLMTMPNALVGGVSSISLQGTDGVRSFSFVGADFENTSPAPGISGGVIHVPLGLRPHGTVMYGDQMYPVSENGNSEIYDTVGNLFLFVQGSAPLSPPDVHITYTALVPFTLVGPSRLVPPRQGILLPGPDLIGSGVAHVQIEVPTSNPNVGIVRQADYVFGEELPAPIPEPASALLFATGLIHVALSRRRARERRGRLAASHP
jgi:hypothetical protein